LARKYGKPIIPLFSFEENNKVILRVLEPIEYKGKPDKLVMNKIGEALKKMISVSSVFNQWQADDLFLSQKIN